MKKNIWEKKTYEKNNIQKNNIWKNNRGKICQKSNRGNTCQNPNRGNLPVKTLTVGIHLSNTSYLSPYGPCHRLTVILPTNPLHSLPQIHRPLYVLSFPLIQCQHVTPLPGFLRIHWLPQLVRDEKLAYSGLREKG